MVLSSTVIGCKKENPEPEPVKSYHPDDNCFSKYLRITGRLIESESGLPVEGLKIGEVKSGSNCVVTDKNGNFNLNYWWRPCGKMPVQKSSAVIKVFNDDMNVFWEIDVSNTDEGETLIYDLQITLTGSIEVIFKDRSGAKNDYLLKDFNHGGEESWISLPSGTDTIIRRKAIQHTEKNIVFVVNGKVYKDTSVFVLPDVTTSVFFTID